MNIDRNQQRLILEILANDYPKGSSECLDRLRELQENDSDMFFGNLQYLKMHGLIEAENMILGNGNYQFVFPKLTAKGIDYLLQDGGLSAIIPTQIIKLHPNTLTSFFEQAIAASKIADQEKHSLIARIKRLPGDGLIHLLKELIEKNIPDLVSFLRP